MKRTKLLLLSVLCAAAVHAQLNDGYYRIQNQSTSRYISPSDNYGYYYGGTMVDVSSLTTIEDGEDVYSDPSTIIYIKKATTGFDLIAQGYETYPVFEKELSIWDNGDGTYKAYVQEGNVAVYLFDGGNGVCVTGKNLSYPGSDWYVKPVDMQNNFFGVKADILVGYDYYKGFYADFPFTVASTTMKAYTIDQIDETNAKVIITEATGTVEGGTPVIFKCTSDVPSANMLNISGHPVLLDDADDGVVPSVKGAYFCNPVQGFHRNVVEYDAETMRVLGTYNGQLAFVTASLQYLPANSIYIKVNPSCPAVLYVTDEQGGGGITPELKGDVNGDGVIDGSDYVRLCRMIMGEIPMTSSGDINGDGEVNVTDAVLLAAMI